MLKGASGAASAAGQCLRIDRRRCGRGGRMPWGGRSRKAFIEGPRGSAIPLLFWRARFVRRYEELAEDQVSTSSRARVPHDGRREGAVLYGRQVLSRSLLPISPERVRKLLRMTGRAWRGPLPESGGARLAIPAKS